MSFFNLNEKQKEAVAHLEGPLLVLAGAGSGKTRVVSERIAKLIELGINPSDILAVTFTNKAAAEMKSRIQKKKNVSVLTCTFHSLGAKILRESIHPLGYSTDFTIYDEEDSIKLIKSCLADLQEKEDKGLAKNLKFKISAAKNELLFPEDITKSDSSSKVDVVFPKIYPHYQSHLKTSNAVDFDDLLLLPVALMQEHQTILQEYQNRWLFILIDEYQDTNFAQYSLTKLLTGKHKNLFAVGDPDQSIYSWRGARYQNILNFSEDFPGSKIVKLEQNYRSTQTILNASNSLISQNQRRYEKKLWSALDEGEKIGVFSAQNDQEEASFVVEKLSEFYIEKKIPLHEIVIFYRTNAQSRIYEDALLASQIPYEIIGGLSFYQRREIKDILSILKLVLSNSDFVAFSRALLRTTKKIGSATVNKIQMEAKKTGMAIFSFCESFVKKPQDFALKLQTQQLENLKTFVQTIVKLRCMDKPVSQMIEQSIEQFSYLDILKEDQMTFEERKENIEELVSKAVQWQQIHDTPKLFTFLEELTLKADSSFTRPASSIKLMTIHNGKGLEFTLVFIVGLEEELFPHANAKNFPEDLEEERRLCYVAMTRAKKYLFLTNASYRFLWGSSRLMLPSRFLNEIPTEYLHNYSSISQHFDEEFQEDIPLGFSQGDVVEHKEFGKGIIQKVYQTSYGITYDVTFHDSNITRSLVGKYAKLKRFIS